MITAAIWLALVGTNAFVWDEGDWVGVFCLWLAAILATIGVNLK